MNDLETKLFKHASPFREASDNLNYSTYHFPKFKILTGQRNTQTRFVAHRIGNLKGKSILDLGCCTGAMSLEAIRLGAKSAVGYDYNKDKVEVANDIAKYLKLKNVTFHQMDFSKEYPVTKRDIVFCLSLDAHLEDPIALYHKTFELTKETCYFESNRAISQVDMIALMKTIGWSKVEFVGVSLDDPYKRNLYILTK